MFLSFKLRKPKKKRKKKKKILKNGIKAIKERDIHVSVENAYVLYTTSSTTFQQIFYIREPWTTCFHALRFSSSLRKTAKLK